MSGFALLVVASLLLPVSQPPAGSPPATVIQPEPPAGSPVALLGSLVPPHHALHGFTGEAGWYEYASPPAFRYERPDFEAWAAELEKAPADPDAARFTVIWRDGGAIRHVLSRGDHVRLFTVDGDTVEFEDPGFHTQVGVARWGFEYGGGLLRTHRTWRLTLGPTGTDRPVGPPAPTALFSVTTYEYRKGSKVPARSRTYWSEADRQAGRWGQRTWYGPDGRRVKTKNNPERPYPY